MKTKILNLKKEKIVFPKKIKVNNKNFFVIKNNKNYFLASRICPHQGGKINFNKEENCFLCPLHNWKFDKSSGKSINSSQDMNLIKLNLVNNILWVDNSKIQNKNLVVKKNKTLTTQKIKRPIKIQLISHATLKIKFNKINVLIDPWIEGPAMLGAWRQYPLTDIKAKDLKPYAIIITHEHSDHFHIPTLLNFHRNTPIFVPNFPNGRIQKFLKRFGFNNVNVLNFEKEKNIHKKITIKFFKPVSVFNDSIAYMNIDGYKFLNLNDAGLNPKIADELKPVDLISCIFSTGASGYPFTWQHLNEKEKKIIMQKACEGRRKMLIEATNLYEANYMMPFASHFRLWQPEHKHYLESVVTNTIDDIVKAFEDEKMEKQLIDLIPGDTWDIKNHQIKRKWKDRKSLYDINTMLKNVELDFKKNGQKLKLNEHWKTNQTTINKQQLKNYFLYLNDSPDIKYCENIYVNFKCWTKKWSKLKFDFDFEIFNGVLEIKNKNSKKNNTNFRIEITENILQPIIDGNLSWDEARVGYWIKWWSNTPKVKTRFLRLLQGPHKQKEKEKSDIYSGIINKKMSISSIIEIFGNNAENIFEKYGMYCTGCNLSPWEDIASGAKKHGIKNNDIKKLLFEIKKLSTSYQDNEVMTS